MDLSFVLLLSPWCLLIGCLTLTQGTPTHVIHTDKGPVRGSVEHVDNTKVDMFLGIPYAKPPIGKLRFQHPEPADEWTDVYNAIRRPNCCMQVPDTKFGDFPGATVWNPNTEISEDCLYLNVWTPHNSHQHSQKKAVLVWIYGGAFLTGSSALDIYDGRYLVAETNVIVVSMQFRFGALGYFVLGSPESPGNAGMMDLRMALEWVSTNIHHFGGDVHSVTLAGESSGAVSIGLMMLSSLARGYFHRAILQSGSPQAPWGTFTRAEGRRRSLLLAERMGCDPKAKDAEILDCLRQLPAKAFPENETEIVKGVAQFPFIPVIDGTFLTKSPEEYLREGSFKKIPLLLGSNANEGSWLLVYAESNYFRLDSNSLLSVENYSDVMDQLFKYYPQYPKELDPFAVSTIKFQYRDWIDPSNQEMLRGQVERAVGDYQFTCGVADIAKTVAKAGQDVYLYRFSHRITSNPWPEWMGVLHGDEIYFVFGVPLNKDKKFTEDEKKLSRKIMTFWTNFAKTGNPNRKPGELDIKEWPKFKPTEQLYLNISLNMFTNTGSWGQGVRPNQCAFFDQYLPMLASRELASYNSSCSQSSASYYWSGSSTFWPSEMALFLAVICGLMAL
ncbi:acetylcholinesterase-like [Physella acuta]|uniref:acetylcholinesterase-like n=1 Tax=Physella acuta TaxID=109671 RepID=UPI0027DBF5F9|nr:acetylcholinesterase-like [Physella acuta]